MSSKLPILFFVALFLGLSYHSQAQSAKAALNASKRSAVGTYAAEGESENLLRVPMHFANYRTERPELPEGKKVVRVDLVYTDYPVGRNFDKLNLNRLIELRKFMPALFEDVTATAWHVIAQEDGKNRREAAKLFHGFVLHLEDTEEKKKEVEVSEGEIAELEEAKKKEVRRKKDSTAITSLLAEDFVTKDSLIFNIFDRNPNWQDILVVNDWTGSMHPYGIELLVWYRLNTEKRKNIKQFVFFNDGDAKFTSDKEIGSTGGIYPAKSTDLKDVMQSMLTSMQNGLGGDSPENDIEALLEAQKICPDCKELILIADARAPVRDIELAEKVNKPVRIILCGAEKGIVKDYLWLAYKTKGTLHTLREDIRSLTALKPGGLFSIGETKIRFTGDDFELVEEEEE